MSAAFWSRFPHDPRSPENARLRAADRDRDAVNDLLGTAYAEGRLTSEELDERTDRAASAKTLGELPGAGVAVAVDGDVVPRSDWDRELVEGQNIDILTAVQGG